MGLGFRSLGFRDAIAGLGVKSCKLFVLGVSIKEFLVGSETGVGC